MGNISNIYCRVLASGDIHCINLTWPPQKQKAAGLWGEHFLECWLRETEVWVGIWNTEREKKVSELSFGLCCFACSQKFSRKDWTRMGELQCRLCGCATSCTQVCVFAHVYFNANLCISSFFVYACMRVFAPYMRVSGCVCFSLKLWVLFVEWSTGAHSDRWCKLLIAAFPVAECGGPCPPSLSSFSLSLSPPFYSFFL